MWCVSGVGRVLDRPGKRRVRSEELDMSQRASRSRSQIANRPVVHADDAIRFRLTSLLLTMAVIGGCLAIGRLMPMAGVLFALIAAPAFIRTALASRCVWPDTPAITHSIWQILVFFESLLVVTLLTAVGLLAFGLTLGLVAGTGVWVAHNWLPAVAGLMVAFLFSGLALAATSAVAVVTAIGHKIWPVRWLPKERGHLVGSNARRKPQPPRKRINQAAKPFSQAP